MVRFPNRTGSVTENMKSDNFLKLNDSGVFNRDIQFSNNFDILPKGSLL